MKLARVALGLVGTMVAVSCGAKTGLLAPEETEASVDAPDDVHDASHELDAVEEDVQEEDVVFPDVPIFSDCPDAGATLVYVLGTANELYSFYPPTLTFKNIGTISCENSSTPNSMAVTRSGIAFTNFQDGKLFEVSTANAACKPTTYKPGQGGWTTYGMGYTSTADGGEGLYVSGANGGGAGLGTVDTVAFTLSKIGQLKPPETSICELTGTGSGELYGYCPTTTNSHIVQIDPATATELSSHPFTFGIGSAYAFAFWGGVFWIFHGSGMSTVTEYDPVAQTEMDVATAPILIVGAGVSTCAPLTL